VKKETNNTINYTSRQQKERCSRYNALGLISAKTCVQNHQLAHLKV